MTNKNQKNKRIDLKEKKIYKILNSFALKILNEMRKMIQNARIRTMRTILLFVNTQEIDLFPRFNGFRNRKICSNFSRVPSRN